MKLESAALLLLGVCCLVSALAAAPPDRFFDSDGVRIRFVDVGRGEPIVLVHGFTSTLESWNRGEILQDLSRGYRVVALDCRGHGKSDKPHAADRYGTDSALDVLRLMDYLEIPRAHIVGYSMGARLTGYLLANYPERFSTATFGGSTPIPGLDEKVTRERIARFRKLSLKQTGTDAQDYAALAASAEAALTRDLPTYEQFRTLDVPVLAITGSQDSKLNLDGLNALKGVLQSYELVVIEGARHGTETVSNPRFLESLKKFIATHPIGY